MNSRMNKYFEEEEVTNSRYYRNENLYKEISKNNLETFDIKSNATVIGDNKNEIDVEHIKKILDTKYNETPKRKSIRLEEEEEIEEKLENTKEYDINVILEKARENKKDDNYEEERVKKLRDTQFDILKNLNVDSKCEEEPEIKDDLKSLIDTIALNENKNKEESPLDILSELKGDEGTEVLEGLKEEIEESEAEGKKEKELDLTSTRMINSFYTSSNALKEKDFEDVDDFSQDFKSTSTFVKIIIAVILLVLIIGAVILVKTIFL